MKKTISFLFIISLFILGTYHVDACSPSPDVIYPTLNSVLLRDTTAVGLYKITTAGARAHGVLFLGNENSIMTMVFEFDQTSCGTRINGFEKDEYIVSVFNKNDTTIYHTDLDSQFSFSFKDKENAIRKYKELYSQWEERSLSQGTSSTSVKYSPTTSTLKPGLKNDDNVRLLQQALQVKLGLDSKFKIDGSYGSATIAAVKQFQGSVNLDDDGVAGLLTQSKLADTMILGLENESVEITGEGQLIEKEQISQDENLSINNDIFDNELRKILERAKSDIISFSKKGQNFNEAYSLIVKYNNEMLTVSKESDPLYKSSNGGQYFIYFAKLSNGKYACVDDNLTKDILETTKAPNLDTEQVSC